MPDDLFVTSWHLSRRKRGGERRLYPNLSTVAQESPPQFSENPPRAAVVYVLHLCFLFQSPLPCTDKARKCKLHREHDTEAGIRLMVLCFHCLTWHGGTRVTFLISGMWQMQGRAFSVAGRCVPIPMTRAHIPGLAPHSLEPSDRALLTADCY